MDLALAAALRRAKHIYLTTYGPTGRSGTVPTWCWLHEGAVYFTTPRASLKARRIQKTGRVTVHVGRRDGPAFEGRAQWVDDRPDLEARLLAAYRQKYWLLAPLWMGGRIGRADPPRAGREDAHDPPSRAWGHRQRRTPTRVGIGPRVQIPLELSLQLR